MANSESEFQAKFLKEFDNYDKRLWQKMPTARFSYWSKRELWTLKDFAYLLKEKEPLEKDTEKVDFIPSFFVTYFEDLSKQVVDAIVLDKLRPIAPYPDANIFNCLLPPYDWLEWASTRGMAIPNEFAPILEKEPDQNVETQDNLDPRERTTLLQIIAVLSAEAELDLTKHSKAAVSLQAMGASHGLELPKKKDTIANKLEEARDLQKTR